MAEASVARPLLATPCVGAPRPACVRGLSLAPVAPPRPALEMRYGDPRPEGELHGREGKASAHTPCKSRLPARPPPSLPCALSLLPPSLSPAFQHPSHSARPAPHPARGAGPCELFTSQPGSPPPPARLGPARPGLARLASAQQRIHISVSSLCYDSPTPPVFFPSSLSLLSHSPCHGTALRCHVTRRAVGTPAVSAEFLIPCPAV